MQCVQVSVCEKEIALWTGVLTWAKLGPLTLAAFLGEPASREGCNT